MSKREWWLKKHLGPDDMILSEVAATLKVSAPALRRLLGKEGLKAPSKEYRSGNYWVYIYTPEDVRELREHFDQRITQRN